MLSKIQQWGNSQGVRIPKNLLNDSQIEIGEEVDLSIKAGKIIISPVKKIHGKYNIKDLVAKMPENYQPEEENWDSPQGKEVW